MVARGARHDSATEARAARWKTRSGAARPTARSVCSGSVRSASALPSAVASAPSPSHSSARWRPAKPVAPVIRIRGRAVKPTARPRRSRTGCGRSARGPPGRAAPRARGSGGARAWRRPARGGTIPPPAEALRSLRAVSAPDPTAQRRPSLAERMGVGGEAISSLEPKHPGLRMALRIAVLLLVVGFIALAIAKEAGRVDDVNWRFAPGWLALCLAALLAFQLLHIALWRLTLDSLGGRIEPRRARAIW